MCLGRGFNQWMKNSLEAARFTNGETVLLIALVKILSLASSRAILSRLIVNLKVVSKSFTI